VLLIDLDNIEVLNHDIETITSIYRTLNILVYQKLLPVFKILLEGFEHVFLSIFKPISPYICYLLPFRFRIFQREFWKQIFSQIEVDHEVLHICSLQLRIINE